jgi:hypothetical protein
MILNLDMIDIDLDVIDTEFRHEWYGMAWHSMNMNMNFEHIQVRDVFILFFVRIKR